MSEDTDVKDNDAKEGGFDVVQFAHQCYREDQQAHDEWRTEARKNYDMVAGNQWDAEDLATLKNQQRPAITINRIARTINAIIGTQVSNRQETRFLPRELGDVQKNEVLSAAADWARDQCDAEDEESDAFEDMCTTGMGWTETRLDYEDDPDGMIKIDRLDPLEMGWDPGATKRNLSDARWRFRIKSYTVAEFEKEFPDADMDSAASPWDSAENETNPRTHVYPQDAYNSQQALKEGSKHKIRVMHLQWAEKSAKYRVRNETLDEDAFKKLEPKLKEENVKHVKQKGVRWRQAFIAGKAILGEVEDCPCPYGPTLKCMTYKRDRNKNIWFGLVRDMRDPQMFGNKFFSQILDILNKGAKGGVMAEKDAVEDTRALEEKWARPDSVIWVNSGAISGKKILPKPVVQFPAGLDKLMAFSLDSVHEVPGINLELLGFANRDQPGILEHQRKQAGITILAPLFDAMRRYRKEQGRVLLHFIQEYISDGRLIRIMGQNGNEQYVPLAKQGDTAKYDIIVDEAPTSPNMKERVFGALVEMAPMVAKMGVPMPPELLDYAPIPSALAAKWKELIEQAPQMPPEVQQQMEQMGKELEAAKQENAKLKDKREEMQANFMLKQEEMKLAREQAAADFQFKQEEAQREAALARERAIAELQLQEERNAAEIRIAQTKAAAEIQINRDKAAAAAETARYSAQQKAENKPQPSAP